MKRLYKMVYTCALFLGLSAGIYAQKPGEACETAIEMTEDFAVQITKPQTVWYSAWTFDLPLTVQFAPQNNNKDPKYAPDVEMDFTCTPGFYEDTILCRLFCETSGQSGISYDLPHKPKLNTKTLDDGTYVYYLSLGKQYRDLLLMVGISYNIQVFVKVNFKCAGELSLAPDDLFSNCVDGAKFIRLGDTVQVKPQDKKRHVIVPYVQWQNDTIRYKWEGAKPCTLAIANKCDFDPTISDPEILDSRVLKNGDSLTVSSALMTEYVNNQIDYPNEAGMYFAKFYSEEAGTMHIVLAPPAPVRGGATLLRHNKTYALNANEKAIFALPDYWNDNTMHTYFSTPTEHTFRMTIATDPDFSQEHVLKTYQFEQASSGHWLGILGKEMKTLWEKTSEKYLYVRFDCSEATTISISNWNPSSCLKNTANYINSSDTTFTVQRDSRDGVYKLNYAKWVGGDMILTFSVKNVCKVFVATDCNITLGTNTTEAPNLLYYKQFTQTVDKITIAEQTVASWAERVDEEGFIYMRINHTLQGSGYKIRIESKAPADADPVYEKATLSVACDDNNNVVVNVSESQYVTVKDNAGTTVDSWNATPETSHALDLDAETYTVIGYDEEITINPSAHRAIVPAQRAAGTTADMPTRVTDTTALTVQSGSNYIRLQPINTPATITYLPKAAFGTKPSAYIGEEEIAAQAEFADCATAWKWGITRFDEAQTIEIKAHEYATIFVEPYVCPRSTFEQIEAWDSLEWRGTTYTKGGKYVLQHTNDHGCEWSHTLQLTIRKASYFCEGFNYEHDENGDGVLISYRQYIYESPAEWDYMDGVELQHDGGKTLMDLHKAEENLYKHYTDSLMPITAISWSHRPEGKKTYEPITVEDEPQWIEAGSLALRLQFLCGETYSTSYVTDIDNVDADATPVKRIENGRVIILRGGVRYDMLGNVIK